MEKFFTFGSFCFLTCFVLLIIVAIYFTPRNNSAIQTQNNCDINKEITGVVTYHDSNNWTTIYFITDSAEIHNYIDEDNGVDVHRSISLSLKTKYKVGQRFKLVKEK